MLYIISPISLLKLEPIFSRQNEWESLKKEKMERNSIPSVLKNLYGKE